MPTFLKLPFNVLFKIDLSACNKDIVFIPALGRNASLQGWVLLKGKLGTSFASLNFPLFPHRVLCGGTQLCVEAHSCLNSNIITVLQSTRYFEAEEKQSLLASYCSLGLVLCPMVTL